MSSGLSIADFDGYLDALRESGRPLRLLMLFLAARREVEGVNRSDDEIQLAMATDMPLTGELNFRQVAEKGKGVDWEYLMVDVLSNPDGSMPSAEEAEMHLQGLCLVVAGEGEGDLSGCMVFDRSGKPLPAEG